MAGGSGQLIPDHMHGASWPVFPRLSNYSWRLIWDNLKLRLQTGHPRVTRQSLEPRCQQPLLSVSGPTHDCRAGQAKHTRLMALTRDIPVADLALLASWPPGPSLFYTVRTSGATNPP